MPLSVPVTITLPPIDHSYTVHTDRQRWSADQLIVETDGRAALENAVRENVRKSSTCVFAGLTEADISVTEHPDGSIAMVGRVLCDEADCHTAARRHHLDAAEAIEAKAAADWAAEKHLGLAPGGLRAEKRRSGWTFQERTLFARMSIGIILTAVGAAMSTYDYQRPDNLSGGSLSAVFGQQADKTCNLLAFPTIVAGALFVLFAVISHVTTTRTSKEG
ncbi:hypothetical protein ACFWBC_10340 [Streptomyces sp. NPDC059985]|uniref:hypothetical protein n=1 Tax=Streptomyces sp. NPDC059985 TaxID=3347025 RepID=UPI0036A38641